MLETIWNSAVQGSVKAEDYFRLLESLTVTDLEHLVALALGPEGAERSTAEGVLTILDERFDSRLCDEANSAWLKWRDSLAAESVHLRTVAPLTQEPWPVFASQVRLPTVMEFPLRDGGSLRWGGMATYVRFTLSSETQNLFPDDRSDEITVRLNVSDCEGASYRCEQQFGAEVFLALLGQGESVPQIGGFEPVIQGVRVLADHRRWYLAEGWVRGLGRHPFSYGAKYLSVVLDLYRSSGGSGRDALILKFRRSHGSHWTGPTPEARVKIAEFSAFLCQWLSASRDIVFVRTPERGVRQEGVVFQP